MESFRQAFAIWWRTVALLKGYQNCNRVIKINQKFITSYSKLCFCSKLLITFTFLPTKIRREIYPLGTSGGGKKRQLKRLALPYGNFVPPFFHYHSV
jgi:hypothetical protein